MESPVVDTITSDVPQPDTVPNPDAAPLNDDETAFQNLIKERMKKEPSTLQLKPLQEGVVTKYECCFCERELSDNKDPVFACGECKHFVYCSAECKAKDWIGFHEGRCFAVREYLPRKEIQSSMLRLVWRNRRWGSQFISQQEIVRGQLVMHRVPLLLLIQLTRSVTGQMRSWQRDNMFRDIAIANANFKPNDRYPFGKNVHSLCFLKNRGDEFMKPYVASWDDHEMFQGLDNQTFSPTGMNFFPIGKN